jgi:hypothetical protein
LNIALPALVILIGLLPGIAFYYAYFGGRFEKRRAGVSALEEIGLYVIFAVPIDALAFWVCRKLHIEFDVSMAAHLVAGALPEPAIETISENLREHVAQVGEGARRSSRAARVSRARSRSLRSQENHRQRCAERSPKSASFSARARTSCDA